jgi:DNA-binding response OmpR family regulator
MDKKKIMVIDDEVDFVSLVKMNLEQTQDYLVLGLNNAKDISANVHNFKPDLILLDLVMPSIGGLEAAQILNEDELGKCIPIIVTSALGKDADKLKAYKLGVVDYIVKPVDTDNLIAAIEKALRYKK